MIEDIIEIHSRNASFHPIERNPFKRRRVDVLSQFHITKLIVATRSSVEQVNTYLAAVDAQIQLSLLLTERRLCQVKGISSEYPSPSEIRSYLGTSVGSQRETLRIGSLAINVEEIVCISRLQHHRKHIVLWFNVAFIDFIKASDYPSDQSYAFFSVKAVGSVILKLEFFGHQRPNSQQ